MLQSLLLDQRHLERGLEDKPVASARRPETHAQMPGDVVPQSQIGRRVDLMEFLGFEEGAVILEPERQDSAEIDAHPRPRLELPFVLGTGEIALQSGVGEYLDSVKAAFEGWRQLERPRALAERRPGSFIFHVEPKLDREPTRL